MLALTRLGRKKLSANEIESAVMAQEVLEAFRLESSNLAKVLQLSQDNSHSRSGFHDLRTCKARAVQIAYQACDCLGFTMPSIHPRA
jgi:hypothetical protein